MAGPPRHPDADDTDLGPNAESTAGPARWTYVFWTIGIALVLLVIVLHLTGTIGPGHH